MLPIHWRPSIELSAQEQQIVARLRPGTCFVFLRLHRHEILDEDFQNELIGLYRNSQRGQPPVPPALVALAMILQASTKVSDDEVIEASIMDRRWQLVLDTVDAEETPFCKGTLVASRKRLLEANLGRRLIERVIEVATSTHDSEWGSLLAVLDHGSLWIGKGDETATNS